MGLKLLSFKTVSVNCLCYQCFDLILMWLSNLKQRNKAMSLSAFAEENVPRPGMHLVRALKRRVEVTSSWWVTVQWCVL